ncbi:reverse transcriptase, partial [Globisporangium splendens]
MLGVDPASTASPTITQDDCLHLSDLEWSAVQRLGKVVGEKGIFAILATCPPEQHRLTAIGFVQKEAEERGREATRAVAAQVDFAMSKLAGRAKSWAFGRRMADHYCFRTLAEFKSDIRAAFEPSKSKFRASTEFLRSDRIDATFTRISNMLDTWYQVSCQSRSAWRQAGRSTGEYASGAIVVHETQAPSVNDASCWTTTTADESRDRLVQIGITVEGFTTPLRPLIDTGASSNFVRSHVARELARVRSEESHSSDSKITVRLATGATVTTEKHVARLHVTHDGRQMEGDFIWLDLDDKIDVILGMPWLKKYQPIIDWNRQSIRYPATKRMQAKRPSPRNALAASQCDARVCDGPFSTTFEGEATQKSQGQTSEIHRSVQKSDDEGKVLPMETSGHGSSCEVISVMVTDEDGSHIHEMATEDPPKDAS